MDLLGITTEKLSHKTKTYLESRFLQLEKIRKYVRELRVVNEYSAKLFRQGYCLIIPVFDRLANCRYLKMRNVLGQHPKVKNPQRYQGYAPMLIGLDRLKDTVDNIVIVEGEIDYLAALCLGYEHVLAVPSVHYQVQEYDLCVLPKDVYILMDNDRAGKEAAYRLLHQLYRPNKRNVYLVSYASLEVNDLAELLAKHHGDYERARSDVDKILAIGALTKSAPYKTGNDLTMEILDAVHVKFSNPGAMEQWQRDMPIKIGSDFLDAILAGGLRSGLCGIRGRPHSGKSSFLLSLARSIIENNSNVHFALFSLDATAEQLMAKLLAWLAAIPMSHLLERNLDEDNFALLTKTRRDFRDLLQRIVIEDKCRTVKDIRKVTVDLLNESECKVVVGIDFIEKLQSSGIQVDFGRELREICAELQEFADIYRLPLILLSNKRHQDADFDEELQPTFIQTGDLEHNLHSNLYLAAIPEEELKQYRVMSDMVRKRLLEIPMRILALKNQGAHNDGEHVDMALSIQNGAMRKLHKLPANT